MQCDLVLNAIDSIRYLFICLIELFLLNESCVKGEWEYGSVLFIVFFFKLNLFTKSYFSFSPQNPKELITKILINLWIKLILKKKIIIEQFWGSCVGYLYRKTLIMWGYPTAFHIENTLKMWKALWFYEIKYFIRYVQQRSVFSNLK